MPPTSGRYIMSIPLSRLFAQGQGDLAVLPDMTLNTIRSFVPANQTAFNALLAVPPEYHEVLEVYPGALFSFPGVTFVVRMAMVVCEIGIDQGTAAQLQRLDAGPWPLGRQELTRTARLFVLEMLESLIEIRVEEYGLDDHTRMQAVQCVDRYLGVVIWNM